MSYTVIFHFEHDILYFSAENVESIKMNSDDNDEEQKTVMTFSKIMLN